KSLTDSEPYMSLNIEVSIIDIFVIWNYGPNKVTKPLSFSGTLINDLDNRSLSEIYNWFVDSFNADKYIIFDDDSCLVSGLSPYLVDNCSDLILPRIKDGGKYFYPINSSGTILSCENEIVHKKIFSITSGLCFNQDTVNYLKSMFGNVFDEDFAFYGVDTSFFYRVNMIKNIKLSIGGEIYHSLSKNSSEDLVTSNFRKAERIKDLALQVRKYRSFMAIKSSLKVLIISAVNCEWMLIFIYFQTLVKLHNGKLGI
ncbi:MAG: hypothetical protein ABF331_08455, partial [Hellea sp.]